MQYQEFKKIKNLRPIARDEIVLDCDNREFGDLALRQIGMAMSSEKYCMEVWKAQGQKSYHIHIRNIPRIAELPKKQNKLYKELLIKKYIKRVVEALGSKPDYLDKIDFTLCIPDHLVAAPDKPHFKYKTIKKLIAIMNEGNSNFCEKEIYYKATATEEYKPTVQGSGITAKIIAKISIIDIAEQFGLDIDGHKTLCPFHPDNKTPSLVFYESQGRFHCFGCQADGNIIKFYAALKELNPKFKYKKNEIK